MKKLLYQFDTDDMPAVFDNVVAYDGGADQVTAYGGIDELNVGGLVEGAIFTRGANDKKNTAIFIGGGNLPKGESVLAAVRAKFFAKLPLGFGALKLRLHRACIARLFERNDLVLDAEEIYSIAKTMMG